VRDEIEVPFQNFSFGIAHLVVDAFRKKIGLRLILTACFSAQKSIIRLFNFKNKGSLCEKMKITQIEIRKEVT
jgi:hypothetical protein